jgi:hypothetical protein
MSSTYGDDASVSGTLLVTGSTIFNEDSHPTYDFRVESDGRPYALWVDSGNDRIGLGCFVEPNNTLEIHHEGGDADQGIMIIRYDGAVYTNNLLGGIGFDSADPVATRPSSPTGSGAYIISYAAENHSATNKGGYLTFGTKATGVGNDADATERMRITAAGDVLIQGGTLSSSAAAVIGGTATFTNAASVACSGTISSSAGATFLGTIIGSGDIQISGNVGIGMEPAKPLDITTSTNGFPVQLINDGNSTGKKGMKIQCGVDDPSAATNVYLLCNDGDGTASGQLQDANGTFSAADTSDRRLKQNIVDTELDGLSTINKIKVRDFEWKRSGKKATGFIAQEVRESFPMAASGDESGDLKEEPMMIMRDVMVIPLIKAVQELSAKVKELEERLDK